MPKNQKKSDFGKGRDDLSQQVGGMRDGCLALAECRFLSKNPEHAQHPFGGGGSKRFAHAADLLFSNCDQVKGASDL